MEWAIVPLALFIFLAVWFLDRKVDGLEDHIEGSLTERIIDGEQTLSARINALEKRLHEVESGLDRPGFPFGKGRREVESGEKYLADDSVVYLGPTSDDNG